MYMYSASGEVPSPGVQAAGRRCGKGAPRLGGASPCSLTNLNYASAYLKSIKEQVAYKPRRSAPVLAGEVKSKSRRFVFSV